MMAKRGRKTLYPDHEGTERKVYGKKIPESEFDILKPLIDKVIIKLVNNSSFRNKIENLVNQIPKKKLTKSKSKKKVNLTPIKVNQIPKIQEDSDLPKKNETAKSSFNNLFEKCPVCENYKEKCTCKHKFDFFDI